jgi:Cys-tRNA(Pro)/Cys-tRNA(Cys) deacylase
MSPEVERVLTEQGVTFKVHHHAPSVSFEDAKALLPFDPALMVKGLAFRLPDGRSAIVAMRAADRADYKKIADALGIRRADLRMATADELSTDLGMQVGGVAPLPVNGAIVLLDRGVLDLNEIICGTGRSDSSLEISRTELERVAAGTVGDFSKPA